MLRLFCLFYATVPFPYSSKYLLFYPKVRVLEFYEIPLLGCRFSCRSGVKWSMSWKKVSRRSFFTPFNFYTSIKFLTFRRLLLCEIENSSPVVFFVAHYGANWARICVGETNFWMLALLLQIPQRFKLDFSLLFWCIKPFFRNLDILPF